MDSRAAVGMAFQSPYPSHTHRNPHGNPHTHGSPDGQAMTPYMFRKRKLALFSIFNVPLKRLGYN